MKVSLALARTSLVVGESPRCTLTFEAGGAPETVPNPVVHPDEPVFRLAGPAPGEATDFTPTRGRATLSLPRPIPSSEEEASPSFTLAAGARRTFELEGIERFSFPRSGRYEVSVAVGRGASAVVSNAVPVEVLPASPVHVTCQATGSRLADEVVVALVQGGAPASLHLRGVANRKGQLVPTFPVRVADVPAAARPVLSVVPNGEMAPARVVAWVEGAALRAAHVGARGVTGTSALPLAGTATLLAPFVLDPTTLAARGLVLLEEGGRRELQGVTVREREAVLDGEAVAFSVAAPAWVRVLAPSTGAPTLFTLSDEGPFVALHALAWRGAGARRLGRWTGTLAGADAVLDADDRARGVVGLRLGGELLVVAWSRSREGRFEAASARAWDWPRELANVPVRIRVDAEGQPHALARAEDGTWLYAPPLEPPRAVLPEGARVAGPLELSFVRGTYPLLLWSDPDRGLVFHPLGFSMRPDSGPEVALPKFADGA